MKVIKIKYYKTDTISQIITLKSILILFLTECYIVN